MKIKQYFSLNILSSKHRRIAHGIKTAVACLVGTIIERHYDWPSGQWVPITIMVVMSAQTHFGGVLRKAYMRFLGTASGVVIAIAALWFFGSNTTVILCVIFLASMLFAYIASGHGDINYAGTLGGVTVILMLAGRQTTIETAIERGLYIVIGIIIALLFSRFFFPVHARDRLRYHIACTLRNLGRLYANVVELQATSQHSNGFSSELNSIVTADIAAQPHLIYEAAAGSLAFSVAQKSIFTAILSSEHALSRLINLMYLSLHEVNRQDDTWKQLAVIEGLHFKIDSSLKYFADCFEKAEEPKYPIRLTEDLQYISHLVEKTSKNSDAKQIMAEYSFLFLMEQVLKELENLRELIIRANGKDSNSVV